MKLRYRGSRVIFLEDEVSSSNSSSSSSSSTKDQSDTSNRSSSKGRRSETSVVERIRYRGHFLKCSSIQEEEVVEEGNKNNPHPTKIILSKRGEKDGILWIIVSIVPIFVLYILSTNSLIANLGKGGGGRDHKTKMLQKMLFTLSMKKQQEDMLKEYRFMEAIEDDICHDYPKLDVMSTVPVLFHRQEYNSYSGIGRGQPSTKNRKQTKNDMVRRKRGLSNNMIERRRGNT